MANILIACEESQRIATEFRALGHNAYSCDIVNPSGGHPEYHIKQDVTFLLTPGPFDGHTIFYTMDDIRHSFKGTWDLIIAHPPCTYLTTAATSMHSLKRETDDRIKLRTLKRINAIEFFMQFIMASAPYIAVENPVGIMSTIYRKPDQIIHPYMFADSIHDTDNYVTKKTCLWLKNLPPLITNDLPAPDLKLLFGTNSKGKNRNWTEINHGSSKTFPGIAKAIAQQWSEYLLYRK